MKTRILLAALMLACLPLGASAQSPQQQAPSAQEGRSAKQKQRDPTPTPLAEEVAPAQEGADRARDEQDWREGQLRITSALAAIAFLQLLLASIAVRAAYVQARAYITLHSLNVEILDPTEQDGPAVAINAIIENTGKTPARKVACGVRIVIAPPDAGEKQLALHLKHRDKHVSDIGPGCKGLPLFDRRALTVEEFSDIVSGKLTIFVVGLFAYRDTMGFPQSTSFRMYHLKSGAHGNEGMYDHAHGNHST